LHRSGVSNRLAGLVVDGHLKTYVFDQSPL
jgi:hypothetical protein